MKSRLKPIMKFTNVTFRYPGGERDVLKVRELALVLLVVVVVVMVRSATTTTMVVMRMQIEM